MRAAEKRVLQDDARGIKTSTTVINTGHEEILWIIRLIIELRSAEQIKSRCSVLHAFAFVVILAMKQGRGK